MLPYKLYEKLRDTLFANFCKANAKFILDNGLRSDFYAYSMYIEQIFGDDGKIPILSIAYNVTSFKVDEWEKMRDKVFLITFNQYLKSLKKYGLYRRFLRDSVEKKHTTNFFNPRNPYCDRFCCCNEYIMNWKSVIRNFDFNVRLYYSAISRNIWSLEKEKYYDNK